MDLRDCSNITLTTIFLAKVIFLSHYLLPPSPAQSRIMLTTIPHLKSYSSALDFFPTKPHHTSPLTNHSPPAAGKQKKTKKYATMKWRINPKDKRIKPEDRAKTQQKKKEDLSAIKEREVPQVPSCLFFQYNTNLGPPYHILVDTNFINFSIKAKLDLVQSMMDCLYAKCVPCITDCVMAELEKLGQKYRVALR
ncbi:rRNA-processing protein FCF1 homolog [Pelodytes ibericus]